MKKDNSDININFRSGLGGLLLVIVAALTLALTSLVEYYFAQKATRMEATARAESQLESTENRIMDVINQAEAAVRNSVWIATWCLDYPDSLVRIPQRLVKDNPVVMGSTIALVPGYYKKQPLLSPYVLRAEDTLLVKSLATPEYNYPEQEWFKKPIEIGEGYWSEPYIDVGGGEELMTTYAMPIKDRKGKVAAVLTADISLDWLTELVGNVKVYPHAFSMVISREGQIMVCPVESLVMQKTVSEVVSTMEDTTSLLPLSRAMMAGETGNADVTEKGVVNKVFFAPIERTGWSMSIVIPEKEINANVRKVSKIVRLLQILGILMLLVILRSVAKSQLKAHKLGVQREKMQGELKIASDIQMAMVPKTFPPFPDRHDVDLAATIVPAKEVGGDLYDFYIRDEKLFFCIGDVSGKGVPASLVMAVTRSLFRTISAHDDNPSHIVKAMNMSMSDSNDSLMFVTFFCGVLNLKNGHLRYCNAGHNVPIMLKDNIEKLGAVPNLPLGVMKDMEFEEQAVDLNYDDAIFLYTDGLTEAENSYHELFGEERMKSVLHGRKNPEMHLQEMKAAVSDFVGEAPQSDDLTMLFIHYLNDKKQDDSDPLHITLQNDVSEISRLAEFVAGVAKEKKLSDSVASNLNLALEEAVTNVIMYAYPEGTKGTVDIYAVENGKRLEFVITDSGAEFDPTQRPDVDTSLSAEEREIGGLGIFLVRKIMDKVTYERKDGKNVLSMIKNI